MFCPVLHITAPSAWNVLPSPPFMALTSCPQGAFSNPQARFPYLLHGTLRVSLATAIALVISWSASACPLDWKRDLLVSFELTAAPKLYVVPGRLVW